MRDNARGYEARRGDKKTVKKQHKTKQVDKLKLSYKRNFSIYILLHFLYLTLMYKRVIC